MRAEDLLHDLRGKDIQLTVQGERLTYDAPAGVMTEALLALVRQHKAALLALLTQEDAEWHDERAAILEYEGGLSRAEADRQAPQHPGGLRLVDAAHPCLGCGS